MPIDPVKIPQNVYVEDRIIGPITLKQIMITLGGAGVSYGVWAAMKAAGNIGTSQLAIAWSPCAVAVAFAFVKINGMSLFRILLLSLERINKPTLRKWTPREGLTINIVTKRSRGAQSYKAEKHKEKQAENKIRELSEVLDRGPEEQEEELNEKRPVNPKRVQAKKIENANVDGITKVRDISPPAHE